MGSITQRLSAAEERAGLGAHKFPLVDVRIYDPDTEDPDADPLPPVKGRRVIKIRLGIGGMSWRPGQLNGRERAL